MVERRGKEPPSSPAFVATLPTGLAGENGIGDKIGAGEDLGRAGGRSAVRCNNWNTLESR